MPALCCLTAQVEKQQRVLPGMSPAHPIIKPPLVTDMVGQGRFVGLVNSVLAIYPRVALRAVVVDQQRLQTQAHVDLRMQFQQRIALQAGVKTLHQQLRAIAVDGQAAGAFLAAMKQAIAVGALPMQLGKQRFTVIEGDAERLIQGRHAKRLGLE